MYVVWVVACVCGISRWICVVNQNEWGSTSPFPVYSHVINVGAHEPGAGASAAADRRPRATIEVELVGRIFQVELKEKGRSRR